MIITIYRQPAASGWLPPRPVSHPILPILPYMDTQPSILLPCSRRLLPSVCTPPASILTRRRRGPLTEPLSLTGGAGTVCAGLHAGVPQLLCPLLFDQSFWAEKLAWIGATPPWLQPHELCQPLVLRDRIDSGCKEAMRRVCEGLHVIY